MTTNIEYTNKELLLIMIENTLKMLVNRELFNNNDIEKYISNVDTNKNLFEIKLINDSIYNLYILNISITTISSGTQLDDFLSENINIHKIVIGKNVSKKVVKQLYNEYKNVEFFFDYELLEDKSTIVFIPKHRKLSLDEIKEININENSFPHIKLFDAMVRYYNGKVGDIFEITRPSINSGYSIEFRKVVMSSSDIIFPN